MSEDVKYTIEPGDRDLSNNQAIAKSLFAGVEDRAREIAKSMFVAEGGGQSSNAQEQLEYNEASDAVRGQKGLVPPYDPDTMAQICENSSALRPNIDAYVINIDSYGHTLKPVIDLSSADAPKKIKQALRYLTKQNPTDAEVKARADELENEIADERQKLEAFFENCAFGMQFSGPEGLRGLTRLDLETTGNAYWEVLRNGLGEVVAFNRLPSRSMRLTRVDTEITSTMIKRRTSLLGVEEIPMNRRFRKFIQSFHGQYVQEGKTKYVYFKEFGDPRVISSLTGNAFESEQLMLDAEEHAKPATEIIYFKISTPRSEYGIPRWIGVLLAVLGTRQAEEVNFMYFDNKSVPPLAVLVSGGRLSSDSVTRIQDYIGNNLKGRKNFHNILILEAESAMATQFGSNSSDPDNGRMKIMLQPLIDAQQQDAQFLNYDEKNADKVGQVFRLPRLLRGDIRDFNRSTAQAALDFAEVQVFNPLRQQFDWVMNRLMFEVLDCRYHEFVTSAATIRDPEALAKMIGDLTKVNVLTPEEARSLAEDVFHTKFLKLDAAWTKAPIGITVSGANQALAGEGAGQQGQGAGALSVSGAGDTQQEVGVGSGVGATNKALASAINKLHDLMIKEERAEFLKRDREIVKVPNDIFYGFGIIPDKT